MKSFYYTESFRNLSLLEGISIKPKPHSGFLRFISKFKLTISLFYCCLSAILSSPVLLLSGMPFALFSQQPTLEWVTRYPDSTYGRGEVITIDNSGCIYVTGAVTVNNHKNYCTVKYNNKGGTIWLRLFAGIYEAHNGPSAMVIDRNHNVIVTGGGNGNPGGDYLTVKYDSAGNEQWFRYYNGLANNEDFATAIVVDNNNNIYVTGHKSVGGNSFVYCTIKYNSEGEELWVRDYGTPGSNAGPNAMVIDANSNLFITGMLNDRATTVSCDSAGNFRWSHQYDLSWGNAIALDRNYNVYVTGYCAASMYFQFFTIKYNMEGNVQWVRNYQKCDTNGCQSEGKNIAVDSEGNIVVSGTSSNVIWGGNAATIIKYTNTGDTVWLINKDPIPGRSIGELNMAVDSFSDIYLTGRVLIGNLPYVFGSYYTFKYNNSGELKWTVIFGGRPGWGDTRPRDMMVDNSGNIYITGKTRDTISGIEKMMTIKYSQPIGIIQISSSIPEEYKLEQNYPNPFNPNTNFEFVIARLGFVRLSVYDILGREIDILVNKELQPGTYEVDWNASNFSSGVYFYMLQASEFKETKKMLLIK